MARERAERAGERGIGLGGESGEHRGGPRGAGASAQGLLVDEGGLERVLVQLVEQGEAGGEARVVRRQGANEGHGDKLGVWAQNSQ